MSCLLLLFVWRFREEGQQSTVVWGLAGGGFQPLRCLTSLSRLPFARPNYRSITLPIDRASARERARERTGEGSQKRQKPKRERERDKPGGGTHAKVELGRSACSMRFFCTCRPGLLRCQDAKFPLWYLDTLRSDACSPGRMPLVLWILVCLHDPTITTYELHIASELSTPTPGKSSLKRLCKQFSTPLIEPGVFFERTCF